MPFDIGDSMLPLMERLFGKGDTPKPKAKPKKKSRSKRAKLPNLKDLLG